MRRRRAQAKKKERERRRRAPVLDVVSSEPAAPSRHRVELQRDLGRPSRPAVMTQRPATQATKNNGAAPAAHDDGLPESVIRDALACELSVLEPGLVFVQTEFKVSTPDGSRGSIDILARDAVGLYVIIELKRSDATAREALHELQKYIGVLPFHLRVPAHRIRCMLVSTEWRELRRPFSNFKENFPHPLDGFELTVDATGKPVRAISAEPPEPLAAPGLSEAHTILFFESAERRDAALRPLERSLKRHGLEDAFILVLNHTANDPRVVHRFAAYVAHYHLPEPEDDVEARRRGAELLADVDANPDAFATSFEELLMSRVLTETRHLRDSLEVISPRKLGTVLGDWSMIRLTRLGAVPPEIAASNEEMLQLLAGVTNAANRFGLRRHTSPRFAADWRAACRQVHVVLSDDKIWQDGAEAFLRLVAREMSEGKVSIAIHVVDHLLSAMRERAAKPASRALPYVEIVAEANGETRAMLGILEWDGETWPASAARLNAILEQRHPGFWGIGAFGRAARRFTDEILALHGLQRKLLVYRAVADDVSAAVVVLNQDNELVPVENVEPERIPGEWFDSHADYFAELDAVIRTRVLEI